MPNVVVHVLMWFSKSWEGCKKERAPSVFPQNTKNKGKGKKMP